MSSMRWTGSARASLIVLSFLVHAVHSFIPASPSNSTDATADLLNATLNVFWFSQGQLTMNFARAAATSDSSGVATGALVHYTDDAPSGTTTTPWVALVACDQNAPDATPDDIFARAKNSGAQAGVLYSLFSSTCIVNPGYSNSPLDVYVSTSLVSSKLLENVFRNVDAAKFGTFNPATLDSESANVSLALSDGFNVDPGYPVAVIAARVPIFSSVYTALPTSRLHREQQRQDFRNGDFSRTELYGHESQWQRHQRECCCVQWSSYADASRLSADHSVSDRPGVTPLPAGGILFRGLLLSFDTFIC